MRELTPATGFHSPHALLENRENRAGFIHLRDGPKNEILPICDGFIRPGGSDCPFQRLTDFALRNDQPSRGPLVPMRLLNTATLDFEEFFGEAGHGIPHYAILSHTWGPGEVSYRDYVNGIGPSRQGWAKVRDASKLASEEGFAYLWIDTCCIDKSSSAELSEAINSMFRWYRDAAVCYAHLSDVSSFEDPTAEGSSFSRSRWFTRGWTLQELLAPKELVFVGSDWVEIGTKKSLQTAVSTITRIDVKALGKQSWPEYSIAQKMSWAVGRQTTRLEDEAYCLIGLFDVNMPLLYGEARKAFSRLQQEILRTSDDQSLFTWAFPESGHSHTNMSGLLAPSPEQFRYASRIQLLPYDPGEEYETAFELVHQVVRTKLRCADGVEGLRLRPVRAEPPVSMVLEARQIRSALVTTEAASAKTQSVPPKPSVLQNHLQPAVAVESPGDVSTIGGNTHQRALPVPTITIETEDTDAAQDYGHTVVTYLDKRVDHNSRADFERPPPLGHLQTHNTEAVLITEGRTDLTLDSQPSVGLACWNRYIYEPVIVAPLRCQLNGQRLGILLSRDATGGGDGLLSRLHYPSLVALDGLEHLQLTTVIKYARISTRVKEPLQWRPWEARPWPEIRISSVTTSDFTVLSSAGPNWILDDKGGVLRPKSLYPTHHRANTTELAPLALFEYVGSSADWRAETDVSMFFLSIPICEPGTLVCEVGIFRGHHTPMSPPHVQFYSCDLASTRHARVPLSNGQSMITLKYREGAGVSCVNVSVGTWTSNVGAIPILRVCDETNTPWLTQRLFPVLRSMGGAAATGGPRVT